MSTKDQRVKVTSKRKLDTSLAINEYTANNKNPINGNSKIIDPSNRPIAGNASIAIKNADSLESCTDPPVLKLDERLMHMIARRQLEVQKIDADIARLRAEREITVLRTDAQIGELQRSRVKAEAAYVDACESISKELNIKFTEYAYDDETGALHHIRPGK